MNTEIKADELVEVLAETYSLPYWNGFAELRDIPPKWGRRIDFFAISVDNKKGYGYSIAFEIKVTRADFGHEIDQPLKRSAFFEQSNEFYFVTPQGLVSPDEIPENCGLMEYDGTLKRVKVAQQRLDISYSPEFVASILGRQVAKRYLKPWYTLLGREVSKETLDKYISKEVRDRIVGEYDRIKAEAGINAAQEESMRVQRMMEVISKYIVPEENFEETLLKLDAYMNKGIPDYIVTKIKELHKLCVG